MSDSTLFTPDDVTEPVLAAMLERQFEAYWFPEYHRFSIDTEEAVVFVDYDAGYLDRMTPDERRALVARLGFTPAAALHVSGNYIYPGSDALAERVALALGRQLGGRPLAAA